MIERKRFDASRRLALLLVLFATTTACSKSPTVTAAASSDAPAAVTESQPAAQTQAAPAPNKSATTAAPRINAARAMQYTKEMVALGPRPVGSAGHKKFEQYLLSHLKQDQVEQDAFTAATPEGQFPMVNYIAKFPGTKDGVVVIASHYDTNYPLRNTTFIGANDGACTSALLLEIANVLRAQMKNGKREGYSVWLLWTDGEEAVKEWTPADSLYGSKHLAAKWQADGTAKKIKAFLLADMIGDADLDI